jgi:hypothetical protein
MASSPSFRLWRKCLLPLGHPDIQSKTLYFRFGSMATDPHPTLKVCLQYIPEVKGNFLNVRVGLNNGHLTKSLRNYFVNVRSPAEVAIPWLHLEVRNAA